jgi:hypothetical protein
MRIATQQHDVLVLDFLPIVTDSEGAQQPAASAAPTSPDEQHDVSTASASEVDSTGGAAIGVWVHSASSSRVGNRPAERKSPSVKIIGSADSPVVVRSSRTCSFWANASGS